MQPFLDRTIDYDGELALSIGLNDWYCC